MNSPSTGRKLVSNGRDARLSDDAPGMARGNDSNFLKRTGETSDWGRLSFAYFSLATQRKVRPAAGKMLSITTKNSNGNLCQSKKYQSSLSLMRLPRELLFFACPKKSSQKKGHPNRSCFLRASQIGCRSHATSMLRRHSNGHPARLPPNLLQCSASS